VRAPDLPGAEAAPADRLARRSPSSS